MKNDYLIIIPARYKSKRLPGKPLIKILGVPMLVRTYNQCRKVVDKKKIIVATDDKRICHLCKKYKIKYILTSKKCLTGTDRVAEVSKKIKAKIYINVQGDEPICNPKDLKKLIFCANKYPNEIINGYCEIKDKKSYHNRQIPKIVFSKDGYLLYMSRGPIPNNKKNNFQKAWRQVCIYSLPEKALKIFREQKKKTLLEEIEDLELLRFSELGIKVKMIPMSNKSISVDTKKDIKIVENILKQKKN